jgi:hypothetical protein
MISNLELATNGVLHEATPISVYFRLASAHLFLCAAATLARPSALIVLRFLVGLSGAVWSVSSVRAFSRRLISSSMLCRIAVRSIPVIIVTQNC